MKRLTDKEVKLTFFILNKLIGSAKYDKEVSEFFDENFYKLECKVLLSENQLKELKQIVNHLDK